MAVSLPVLTILPSALAAIGDARPSGLHPIDWMVVAAYLAVVLGMGWFIARKTTDGDDYFTASRRHIHPVLVGISTFAGVFSAISYLGKPGEMINKGPYLLIGQILSVPFAYLIVGYIIVPRLMQQRVTSAYELLEARLGIAVRLLGAIICVSLRLVWMGTMLYLASMALTVIFRIDASWAPLVGAAIGMVSVMYTSMGGLRTVVMADVFQFILMLLGIVLSVALVTYHSGGFAWIPSEWSPQWDRQPWFSLDPHERVTVFTATLSMLLWRVATAGGDQASVQRYMATADARAARRSYLVTELATVVVTVMLALLGLALLGFFSEPGRLEPGMTLAKDADRLYPYFVSHFLPVGFSGLVVAALIASMSNVDTGVSAISSVVMRDFLERFGLHPKSEAARVRFSRWLAFGVGVLAVSASLLVRYVPGNFMEITSKSFNLLTTPLFVLFILALWVPFSTPLGAILGCIYGVTTAVVIAFWDLFTGRPALSFQLVGLGAFTANLAVALIVSRWGPRRNARRQTWLVGGLATALLAGVVMFLL